MTLLGHLRTYHVTYLLLVFKIRNYCLKCYSLYLPPTFGEILKGR
jgi:hypothetical protein